MAYALRRTARGAAVAAKIIVLERTWHSALLVWWGISAQAKRLSDGIRYGRRGAAHQSGIGWTRDDLQGVQEAEAVPVAAEGTKQRYANGIHDVQIARDR